MRSRRPTAEHQEAVSRRLALLSAELAGASAGNTLRDPAAAPEPEPAPDPDPVPEPVPQPVPRPGRHASRWPARRSGLSPVEVLPEALRGRIALAPGPLAVVAVLVAVGLAVTTWWVVRGDPAALAAPLTAQPAAPLVPTGAPATGPSAEPPASSSGEVTVDVTGKVRRPGIAVLPGGSRVVDALEAAGGARRGVDLSSLNLARLLVDGEQVVVGVSSPPGIASGAVPGPSPAAALVNLNTAEQAELETLPEVGPVTATAILAWRSEHGGFTAVEELLEVDGIGEATLATIAPHVTV